MKIIPKYRTGNELKAKEKWDTWFEDYRVPNESGQYATQEDWDNLNNALPELYDLEKQISDPKSNVYKNYIKWKKDPNNTDDRVFIAQEYYKKNHLNMTMKSLGTLDRLDGKQIISIQDRT